MTRRRRTPQSDGLSHTRFARVVGTLDVASVAWSLYPASLRLPRVESKKRGRAHSSTPKDSRTLSLCHFDAEVLAPSCAPSCCSTISRNVLYFTAPIKK